MLIVAKKKKPLPASHSSALFCCAMALLLLAAGCATPIGVTRASTQEIYRALTVNALSAGEPSSWSKQVLQRNNLTEQYDDDPAATLAELHRRQKEVRLTSDRMFALAELSFIAVQGVFPFRPPFVGKNDGVVAYESAHIDGVESELVVNSGHSTQSNPDTILEVRRILREHIGAE